MERGLGHYRIMEKLGEGAMGEVFKGLDTLLEREVAIKLLRPELSNRPDIVERFRTEAVALARLNHTHIATLYSFLPHESQYFMVMELVRGESLAKLIERSGALPWQQAVGLVSQALEGLEHAHRLGVIHRDIKPSNIMVTHIGVLKVMDFGIARILEKARLTRAGHLIGTLEYMSPEQIAGRDTDARADLYSLGVVLYELVTGRVPFEASSDYDLIKAQMEEPPKTPRIRVPDLPAALEQQILRALEKKPESRFESAADFHAALAAIATPGPDPGYERPKAPPETRFVSQAQRATAKETVASKVSAFETGTAPRGEAQPLPTEARRWKSAPLTYAVVAVAVVVAGLIGVARYWNPSPSTSDVPEPSEYSSLNPQPSEDNRVEKDSAFKKPEENTVKPVVAELSAEEIQHAVGRPEPVFIPLPKVIPPEDIQPTQEQRKKKESKKLAERTEPPRPRLKPKPKPKWEIIPGETRPLQ